MRLAAIDIGSNSIKLVVVEAAASDSFAPLAREKEIVRLGHETLAQEFLSQDAIDRAADTIGRFRSIAEARNADRIVAVATASVREASNAAEFIETVWRRTGVRVEVLSSIEEARLIGVAVAHGCAAGASSVLNIDIGGGSTELSVVHDGVPVELYSVKLGAIGLTDRYLINDPPKSKELKALREQIRFAMERPARELRQVTWQKSTGTSGTIIAIGAALRAFSPAPTDEEGVQPAGDEIVLSRLADFNQRTAVMTVKDRAAIPGISAQRAEILIAGGQLLEGVMRALSINMLRTCDLALREGVIIDSLREFEAESRPPVADAADPRLRSVYAVGKRFGYEESHARQVTRLAERIFDGLASEAGLSRHQRTLVSAAALLHDAGYHIAHESHHKHGLYLIRHSELTGFSEAERIVIANVARYHRGGLPKERHPEFAALNATDRQTVWQLGAIVRLADALDRSYDGRVRDLALRRNGDEVEIHLISGSDCTREIAAAEQKGEMFETAFACRLKITRAAANAA
jgi:exopolyphosphatase/guanosine-5'-triphosphate,3'-diphosphate pyrophosphatase